MKAEFDVFKAFMRSNSQEVDDSDILQAAWAAANTSVDTYCHRRIELADDTATPLRYRPDRAAWLLLIDDCTEITSVAENGNLLVEGTDYDVEPINRRNAAGEMVPADALVLLDRCWFVNGRRATVTVTAKWGWPSIPVNVVEGTKLLGKDIALAREMRGDVAGINDFGVVRIRQSPTLTSLLAPYVRMDQVR